jgi:hypothetical protein
LAYQLTYERKAREQLNSFYSDYAGEVAELMKNWLNGLAEAAEKGASEGLSNDFLEELTTILEDIESNDFSYSLDKMKKADLATKIRAILKWITKRSPPWQLRHAAHEFAIYYAVVRVHVIYEIDHLTPPKVIFRKFIDLPNQ